MKLLRKTGLPSDFKVLTYQVVEDMPDFRHTRNVLGCSETQSGARIMALVAAPARAAEIKSLQVEAWHPPTPKNP